MACNAVCIICGTEFKCEDDDIEYYIQNGTPLATCDECFDTFRGDYCEDDYEDD